MFVCVCEGECSYVGLRPVFILDCVRHMYIYIYIYIMTEFNVVYFSKRKLFGTRNCLSVNLRTLPTILTFATTDRFAQAMVIKFS